MQIRIEVGRTWPTNCEGTLDEAMEAFENFYNEARANVIAYGQLHNTEFDLASLTCEGGDDDSLRVFLTREETEEEAEKRLSIERVNRMHRLYSYVELKKEFEGVNAEEEYDQAQREYWAGLNSPNGPKGSACL